MFIMSSRKKQVPKSIIKCHLSCQSSPSVLDHFYKQTYLLYYWPTLKKSLKPNIYLKLLNHFSAPLHSKFSWKSCLYLLSLLNLFQSGCCFHHYTKMHDLTVVKYRDQFSCLMGNNPPAVSGTSANSLLLDLLFLLDSRTCSVSVLLLYWLTLLTVLCCMLPLHLLAI